MSTFDVFSLHVILKCLKERGFLKSFDEKKNALYLSAMYLTRTYELRTLFSTSPCGKRKAISDW